MFFRILALLPLVSLVTANSFVGRSSVVDPVRNDINNMTITVTSMENACKVFQSMPTKDSATTIMNIGIRLDLQIVSATNDCPGAVVSRDDTQILVNALENLLNNFIKPLFILVLELKSAIEEVDFEGQFCVAIEAIITSTTAFMDEVYTCGADEYKDQLGEMRDEVLAEMAQVKASYCVTVGSGGNSKVSGVEI
ncbi:hypothetical protein EV421DRAFT_1910388 [Armillaria borealis]|uniref:Cell wall galactomannoprotein n=1 Tax=Armillaria borealis TaxID=47425 RepID=A0AA39MGX7_9AGAR|nr:hypothetical protein EV421DRAFT_1910388 [Armillaria borealis]